MENRTDIDRQFWEYFDAGMADATVQPTGLTTSPSDIAKPDQGFVIAVYSALLVTGAVGNVAVFTALVRSRRRKSRVNLLMMHLSIADMMVVFIIIPLEIGWRITNAWLAGNLACKIFLVLRAFGLYLSSNVLVAISVDRFFAVVYPLRLPIAKQRSKTMLFLSWVIALTCSLPQSLVFRVLRHPNDPNFYQCVSFDAFASQQQELAYNVICLCAMYFLPLLIITCCYVCIFCEISRNSIEVTDHSRLTDHTRIQLRRSDERPLERARRRTLRMTVTIVTVFACCWLPYVTMTLWYMLDRKSAQHVSGRIQDIFFIMAVSNSCMNPLVYGSYALDLKSLLAKFIAKITCAHRNSPNTAYVLQDITNLGSTQEVGSYSAKRKLDCLDVNGEPGPSNSNIIVQSYKRMKRSCKSKAVPGPSTLKSKLRVTNGNHQQVNSSRKFTGQCNVRFAETSFMVPSARSDPSPRCRENGQLQGSTVMPSKSCEIFTLEAPPKKSSYLNET